ncbi:hypothetical protein LSTR_LSTR014820 [Laodelphax striatellus]|uniref:Uncharacterized protein n=1 Tax=Laodelphax striatellus TaxID=195883 RepID=A0A482WRX3_LAOST|nr:hypothetical protein LSTR_LSTR014820 [Laodelphax striatellus]
MSDGDKSESREKVDAMMDSDDGTDTGNTSPTPEGDIIPVDVESQNVYGTPQKLLNEIDSVSSRGHDVEVDYTYEEIPSADEEIKPENSLKFSLEENGDKIFDENILEEQCNETVQSIIDSLINEYFMRYLFESTKVLAGDVVDEAIEKASDLITSGERTRPESISTFVKRVISEIFNDTMLQRLSADEKQLIKEIARKDHVVIADEETSLSIARDFVVKDLLDGLELKDGEDLGDDSETVQTATDSARKEDEEDESSSTSEEEVQSPEEMHQVRSGEEAGTPLGTFLHPDSEQMQRFQNVLRAHLEKQKQMLEEEINELVSKVFTFMNYNQYFF